MAAVPTFFARELLDDEFKRTLKRLELTCAAAAGEIGISPATAYRVAGGKMPDVESYLRIKHWLASTRGLVLLRVDRTRDTIGSQQR